MKKDYILQLAYHNLVFFCKTDIILILIICWWDAHVLSLWKTRSLWNQNSLDIQTPYLSPELHHEVVSFLDLLMTKKTLLQKLFLYFNFELNLNLVCILIIIFSGTQIPATMWNFGVRNSYKQCSYLALSHKVKMQSKLSGGRWNLWSLKSLAWEGKL